MASDMAFAQKYVANLAAHPINYADDFVTPPEKRPRRMPVVGIELADPPASNAADDSAAASSSQISLTIKSLKPSLTLPVQFSPTEPVSSLKTLIHQALSAGTTSLPVAPAPSTMRLLLKGKALADDKLLKEYDIPDGGVINLMLKSGWEKESTAAAAASPPVPDITLTNSASSSDLSVPTINLPTTITDSSSSRSLPPSTSAQHDILASSLFWKRIYDVCAEELESYPTLQGKRSEVQTEASGIWLELFDAMRSRLTPGEIAKIQDVVGVNGMGGV